MNLEPILESALHLDRPVTAREHWQALQSRLTAARTYAETGDRKRALDLLKRDPSLLQSYSEDGFPALGLAVFFRHPDLARELIERGADVNAAGRNPQRVAPVHSAATVQDHATMRLLLQRGADPNARQQLGFTPFHSAASRGDIEMAKLLVEHGADPRARTDDGKDAISIAQKYGKPEFAEWFQQTIGGE